ncbi:type VI secretion system baseplate subunit TssF [Ramlibacter sp. WS9]|uniref:type VI secretion system baseplate subunit TssF n=1 Tax=Ramlibacter sp. WS9 TaxID=1882741 RepID=UPI001142DB0B|nr:type VI secretion system baseplate subunit TssF [Ramlibacter sp. WS9]ROZ78313.1 type VI secretion system baseplate subunit TssF [Ramlibacter sp. WS9]
MDPRLLRHYNQELLHLREMGAEFAAQFPKIAGRLRIDGLEVSDPYVERLLEGFAFLTARVQLKLEAEFPRFTQRMAEILYPQFLAPIPSMLIAQLRPDLGDAGLASGVTINRGSMMRGMPSKGGATECQFRTGHDTTLWPLEIANATYFTHATNLPLESKPDWKKYAGGVRISLKSTAGLDFSAIGLGDLRFYCSGADDVAYRLNELVCGNALGVFVAGKGAASNFRALEPDAIRPVGFDEEEALLPVTLRGFEGYRLIQEYFAFPHRFLFFDVCGLGEALRQVGGTEAELIILFSRGDTNLLQSVDATSFALNCVPAVNLFEHRCDRVQVTHETPQLHVVPDRVRPMDFEIHGITAVTGFGVGLDSEREFRPLYSAFHMEDMGHEAYYSMQREPRLMSATQRREGPRSSYIGSEVFISLVDPREAPFSDDLKQLGVTALCSNRDLPLLMPVGIGATDLTLDQSAPVPSIKVIKGPSRPLSASTGGSTVWRLINQLTLNHISLVDTNEEQGAAALRQMLRLYAHEEDATHLRQIEGLRSVRQHQVVRRLPMPGPIAFGRGVQLELGVDELAFEGVSAFLFGCVLERYLARHVSINSFTETRVKSYTRGVIMNGRPRCGARPML